MDEGDGGMLGCVGALMKVEQRVKAASQLTQPASGQVEHKTAGGV